MDNEIRRRKYELEPIVTEKYVWNQGNLLVAIIIGIFAVIFEFIAVFFIGLLKPYALFLGFVLIIVYAIFLFFVLEPRLVKEIKKTEIITLEKPVVREVIKSVIKEVPREIVRTVEKQVPQTLTRTVYVPTPRKKLNIPKYDYVASSQTKTFHTRNCRLGKLIKKRYKVSNNSKSYFTGRKYKPCKVCILKKKKV
ncbi:hypothetical protein J4477_01755 [Candidatus Pacearchaeota archaeon]|nr:hypothetical protein [Candidatus Pacearchaeota archaeon]